MSFKVNALVLAAVAALAVGVVGCGGGDKPADAAPQPASTDAAPPADSAAPDAPPADSAAPEAAPAQ